MTRVLMMLALAATAMPVPEQTATSTPISRRYAEGRQLVYLMKGENDGWRYEIRLTSVVRKDRAGQLVEEYAWSEFVSDGQPRPLSAAAQALRVPVNVNSDGAPFTLPDLSIAPGLVGPITDMLTFQADLFLAVKGGRLRQAGDHLHFPNATTTASWADGMRVTLGEDHVDFDISLVTIDRSAGTATILVKHVPPPAPKVRIPADWMRAPVADTPNNWVQVTKKANGYEAAVGKETFDVELKISLEDGSIQTASMVNPVTTTVRDCTDAALTACGPARPEKTLRRIEMTLIP